MSHDSPSATVSDGHSSERVPGPTAGEKVNDVSVAVAPTAAPAAAPAVKITYPGPLLTVVITFALLLALFLVALDIVSCWSIILVSSLYLTEAEHHRNRHPNNHRRVPQRRGHWLVWLRLLPLARNVSGLLGQGVQVLPTQDRLPVVHRGLRAGEPHRRSLSQQNRLNHHPRHPRPRRRGSHGWLLYYPGIHDPPAALTSGPGPIQLGLERLLGARPGAGWLLHPVCDVEVVFLD